MHVKITGLPHHPTINGVDFSELSTKEHKRIIRELSPRNYHQVKDWMVVGKGKREGTLLLQRTLPDGMEEQKEVFDCHAMYSACNFGHGDIFSDILKHCGLENFWNHQVPALPKSIDHKFQAPALTALKHLTGLDMFLLKSTGAEAVETAINTSFKYVFIKRGRREVSKPIIIVPKNNFHGRTRLARSLSSSPLSREGFGPLLGGSVVRHTPYNCVSAIKELVRRHRKNIIAIVLEPVQGEGGVIVPSRDYLRQVAEICRENDMVFILDEVQTGYGRTGSNFAYEQCGFLPDLLCGGKAAGAGIIPVSFVAGRRDIMESIEEGTEGATWSATPIQCFALMSAIKALCDNNLSEESAQKGKYLHDLLKRLSEKYLDIITDVRGQGLFVVIETVFNGKAFSQALLDLPQGAIWAKETGEDGKAIRISPPLTLPKEEIPKIVSSFEKVLLQFRDRHI
ncbi:hypothetical protein CL630_03880 [bacterium]|nr:hypothetical protein [bacterium]|tara:strand:+ start:57511 stop:58872 length:1362 start_codon:yes stop_codon:yes gene_type:complete